MAVHFPKTILSSTQNAYYSLGIQLCQQGIRHRQGRSLGVMFGKVGVMRLSSKLWNRRRYPTSSLANTLKKVAVRREIASQGTR